MANKYLLKFMVGMVGSSLILVGCGEKEPEYKIEGPKATEMSEVAGVSASNAPGTTQPGMPSEDGGMQEVGGMKGSPPKKPGDHK